MHFARFEKIVIHNLDTVTKEEQVFIFYFTKLKLSNTLLKLLLKNDFNTNYRHYSSYITLYSHSRQYCLLQILPKCL